MKKWTRYFSVQFNGVPGMSQAVFETTERLPLMTTSVDLQVLLGDALVGCFIQTREIKQDEYESTLKEHPEYLLSKVQAAIPLVWEKVRSEFDKK